MGMLEKHSKNIFFCQLGFHSSFVTRYGFPILAFNSLYRKLTVKPNTVSRMSDSLQNRCKNVKLWGQTTTKTWYKHSTRKQEVAKTMTPEDTPELAHTTK